MTCGSGLKHNEKKGKCVIGHSIYNVDQVEYAKPLFLRDLLRNVNSVVQRVTNTDHGTNAYAVD